MKIKTFFILIFLLSFSAYSQENSITEIEVRGLKKTKISFVKKLLKIKENKVLDSLRLKKDIIFLKRLPAFSHAYFSVFHLQNNSYKVIIDVEENATLIPEASFWTTTNNQFSYRIGLHEHNFLGRNITLGGFYQNNGFDTFGVLLKMPNLFSQKWGLAFNFQNWKSKEPVYFTELSGASANYIYNNISYEVLGLFQLDLKNNIRFGVNFFTEKYEFVDGFTSSSAPTNLTTNKVLLKSVFTHNNLEYYYQYINGFKSETFMQFVTAKANSQNDFFVFWNDFFLFRRIGNKGNWANRMRFGLSTNNKSPFAPFALDNNLNLRGVGVLVDRGTGSIVVNSEYRHTFYENNWLVLQSNLFIDAGTWRTPGGKLNDFLQSKNIRAFSGFGLRFIHKKIYNAVFRIDYGHEFTNGKASGIIFGIGQYF